MSDHSPDSFVIGMACTVSLLAVLAAMVVSTPGGTLGCIMVVLCMAWISWAIRI